MKEKYEGVEFEIRKIDERDLSECKESRFYFLIYCYLLGKQEIYQESEEWYETEQQARDAAIEYITSKMQNGES